MQRFDYRSPRYPVDLPVRLTAENSTRLGRCKDISREGMKMELQQPLPPDACGTVSMTFQDQTLELKVQVAHAGATQDGMKFIYSSDTQRNAVARLLASLTISRDRRRPILVGYSKLHYLPEVDAAGAGVFGAPALCAAVLNAPGI
jgi:hypothetical protein